MISGRAMVVLGLVGVGLYVLRHGVDTAATMQGLGDAATPDQKAALENQLNVAEAAITTINQLLIPTPPMPVVGPQKVLT